MISLLICSCSTHSNIEDKTPDKSQKDLINTDQKKSGSRNKDINKEDTNQLNGNK